MCSHRDPIKEVPTREDAGIISGRAQLEELARRHEQDADERTEADLRVEMARVEKAESRGR